MNQRRRCREQSPIKEFGEAEGPPSKAARTDRNEVVATIQKLMLKLNDVNNHSLQGCIEDLSFYVSDMIRLYKSDIIGTLLDCVSTQPMQNSVYATLLGLVNVRDYEFAGEVLTGLVVELRKSLELGKWNQAHSLVLLLADLVNTNVVTVGSLLQLLNALVKVCDEDEAPSNRSDFYVDLVLCTLPLVGRELYEKKESALQAMIKRLQVYLKKERNTKETVKLLRIWSNSEMTQRCYLELLWQQVSRLWQDNWIEHQLLRPYLSFDGLLSTALQHKLPVLEIPPQSAQSESYPPCRLTVHLFEMSDYPPNVRLPIELEIERHVIESHILEIVRLKHLESKSCAQLLVAYCGTNPKQALSYSVVEILLTQMLQLPCAPYLTINYGSIIIELCKQKPMVFPRVVAQATDLLYSQVEYMSVSSFDRFVNWLSHHLSNFRYQWSWQDWDSCLAVPKLHPSAMFMRELLNKCIRLSYYQHIVQMLPPSFTPVMPVSPDPCFKYINELLPGATLAKALLNAIRGKCQPEVVGGLIEAATELNESLKINVLMQTFLHLGSKSFTHVFCIFDKFNVVLKMLANSEANQLAMLNAVFELWSSNDHLKYVLAEKLFKMKIVSANLVIAWIFGPAMREELTKMYMWELLQAILRFSKKHVPDSAELEPLADCLLLNIVESCVKAMAEHQFKKQIVETDYWFHWVWGRLQGILFDHAELVRNVENKLLKIVTDLDDSKCITDMIEIYLDYLR